MSKRKKDFVKHIDEHVVLNTKISGNRSFTIDGVEHFIDVKLLYRIGMECFLEQEKNGRLSDGSEASLENMREFPLDKCNWEFADRWYFTTNTHRKPSSNSFELSFYIPEKGVMYSRIPAIWYVLAVYPGITQEMIEEMNEEELIAFKMNRLQES